MLSSRTNYFDNFIDDIFNYNENKLMKTDIQENDNQYIIEIDLPGFNKEDIKVDLEYGYLNINASKKSEINDNSKYIRRERYYGKLTRSFYVGDVLLEDIKANFKNGILKLEIPKISEDKKLEPKKYLKIED